MLIHRAGAKHLFIPGGSLGVRACSAGEIGGGGVASAYSVQFDGTDDYISASDAAFPLGDSARTVSLWIKSTYTGGPDRYFFGYGASGNGSFDIGIWGGGAIIITQTGSWVATSSVVDLSAWTHLAVTYSGGGFSSNTSIYINGVSQSLSASGTLGALATASFACNIGRNPHAAGLNVACSIDDPRVYNTALSAADVANLYAGQDVTAGLVAYWPLEEGCFSDDTEILTTNGWKLFENLSDDDEVATLNSDGYLEYQRPTRYFKYWFNGDMFQQQSKGIDLCVTPNHDMYVRKPRPDSSEWHDDIGGFVRCQAKDLPRYVQYKRNLKWPDVTGNEPECFELPQMEKSWKVGQHGGVYTKTWAAKTIGLVDWMRFLGIWLAEGYTTSRYRVGVCQEKSDEHVRIVGDWFRSCGYSPCYDGHSFEVANKQLHGYLSQFGKCHEKHIPDEVKQYGAKYLRELLTAACLGDGSERSTKNGSAWQYGTTSKRLADDIQEIALKCGYSATIGIKRFTVEPGKYRQDKCYIVSIGQSTVSRVNKGRDGRSWVKYSGFVYDVTVPNHTLLVRRNGKPVWSSNSGTTAADTIGGNNGTLTNGPTWSTDVPAPLA